MIKSDLIMKLSFMFTQYPEKTIAQCVNDIINAMGDSLAGSKRIEIRGFGTFSLHYRPPRRARNPRTGKNLRTKGKFSPHFKPGKELRLKINDTMDRAG